MVAQSNVKKLIEPLRLMQLEVLAGERISGKLPVNGGTDGVDTFIPVTVFHGRDSGPVLSFIAGIRGSEYSPIISMQGCSGLRVTSVSLYHRCLSSY